MHRKIMEMKQNNIIVAPRFMRVLNWLNGSKIDGFAFIYVVLSYYQPIKGEIYPWGF